MTFVYCYLSLSMNCVAMSLDLEQSGSLLSVVRAAKVHVIPYNKLLALTEGLQLALSNNLQISKVECDALQVVQGLKSKKSFAENASLINDVCLLLSFVEYELCRYVPRSGNKVVHWLALCKLPVCTSSHVTSPRRGNPILDVFLSKANPKERNPEEEMDIE